MPPRCPSRSTDDVITSAFRSAGQRCSALRLLCVQEDVADRMIEMIAGAATELALGDPRDPATACRAGDRRRRQARLDRWIADKAGAGPGDVPLGRRPRAAAARHLRAADDHRARPRQRPEGRGVRSDAARRALARRRARRAARRHRRQRLRRSRSASTPASTPSARADRRAACATATSTSTAT